MKTITSFSRDGGLLYWVKECQSIVFFSFFKIQQTLFLPAGLSFVGLATYVLFSQLLTIHSWRTSGTEVTELHSQFNICWASLFHAHSLSLCIYLLFLLLLIFSFFWMKYGFFSSFFHFFLYTKIYKTN